MSGNNSVPTAGILHSSEGMPLAESLWENPPSQKIIFVKFKFSIATADRPAPVKSLSQLPESNRRPAHYE